MVLARAAARPGPPDCRGAPWAGCDRPVASAFARDTLALMQGLNISTSAATLLAPGDDAARIVVDPWKRFATTNPAPAMR